MTWLHNATGLLCSALLFAMFWMGTLSVFDREIDQWMMPHTRLAASDRSISLDAIVRPIVDELGPRSDIYLYLPKQREPSLRIGYEDSGSFKKRYFDPWTGKELTGRESLAATGFIFPFHFSFHIRWMNLGYWLAGFLSMGMLVLLSTGIYAHRKIIAEFFVFRPDKSLRRSTLDLHNMTSLVALPFHFLLPLTGLFIFFSVYLPWPAGILFGGETEPLFAEMYGSRSVQAAGRRAEMASLDDMIRAAESRWSGRTGYPAAADIVRLQHWGDANALVTARRVFPSRQVAMDREAVTFAASTGEVVQDFKSLPIRTAHAWLSGLHFIQFDHWMLRWLYFGAGLLGCVMIATGLLFWLRSRERGKAPNTPGFQTMAAMTVGSTTGLILATAAFLVMNRAIPHAGFKVLGQDAASLEVWAFAVVWSTSFFHAAVRKERAWSEQCLAIGLFAASAAVLNWVTTGHHPAAAADAGLWAVFAVDAMLLLSALAAIAVSHRLQCRFISMLQTASQADASPVDAR